MVANAVKSKDRIECGVCHKTKGCIQTFAEPSEDGTPNSVIISGITLR